MYKKPLLNQEVNRGYTWFAFVVIFMVFSSCSNELDLLAPNDPIPVVYFRMNPADSVYYLTLTRTFCGTGSGYELAKDPDRVFYENADICLEGWVDQYKVWETSFTLTDISKNQGIFPEVPGYGYTSSNSSFSTDSYGYLSNGYNEINSFRLVLSLGGDLGPVLSTIPLIPMPKRTFPVTPMKVLDLCPDGTNYKAGIEFDSEFVSYCELICTFRYQERRETWVDRVVTFSLRKDIQIIDNEATTLIDPELFFTKLALNIQPINDTIIRKFKSLDFIFMAADSHFKDYIDSYSTAGDLDSPPVGNIKNGYGLFTMVRSVKIEKNATMNYRTLDYLSSGEYSAHLGFVRW